MLFLPLLLGEDTGQMPDIAGLLRMVLIRTDGPAPHLIAQHKGPYIGCQDQRIDTGSVPPLTQQGFGPHQGIDLPLFKKLCHHSYHMGLLPLHLQLPVSGLPDGREGSLTVFFRHQLLQDLLRVQGHDDHGTTENSKPDPGLIFAPQELKDRHRPDLRSHIFLRPHNGQLFFLDIVAQDKEPEPVSHGLLFCLHDPADALHLALTLDQKLLQGVLVGQGNLLPVDTSRFLQLFLDPFPCFL